jgi:hypothetical protein
MLDYVTSPQFRNPIENIVSIATDLQRMVIQEAKVHQKVWKDRREYYQRLQWKGDQVQRNLQQILIGEEPAAILPPKLTPLQVPTASE